MRFVAQIDGLSGTGKSSVAIELSRRGYCAVDADTEFAYFGDPATGRPTDAMTRDNWIWDLGRIRSFCATSSTSPLFICGGALNQDQCLDLFTHRFLLRIDNNTMRRRLRNRTNNSFGKHPDELAEQLELNRDVESAARGTDWIIVDATQPLTAVVDVITRSVQ